jgi:tetratricopeptide (TPR) repeat protein
MEGSTTHFTIIKNALLVPPRLFWYLLSLPILAPVLWRIPNHIHRLDWNRLLKSAQFLHRVGFQTESTWYWHALAYANLNQWESALNCFEKVIKPLDPIDREACRWCWHAYVLAKLGRLPEARDLLQRSNIQSWPEHRRVWANEFLNLTSDDISGDPLGMKPN